MKKNKIIGLQLGLIAVITCLLLCRCIPISHTRYSVTFKNCTKDTLYIGASYYDNIDSVCSQLSPGYMKLTRNNLDTAGIFLWVEGMKTMENYQEHLKYLRDEYVYPDSMCFIDKDYFRSDIDTFYLFLVKYRDAKNHSWNEIREKHLFHKRTLTRNSKGDFDRSIKGFANTKYSHTSYTSAQ